MRRSKNQVLAGFSTLLLIACQGNEPDGEEQRARQEMQASFPSVTHARVARPVPADVLQPRQVTDLASAVRQISAVVEGVVTEIHTGSITEINEGDNSTVSAMWIQVFCG